MIRPRRSRVFIVGLLLAFAAGGSAHGFRPRDQKSHLDDLLVPDASTAIPALTAPLESLPEDHPFRVAWNAFRAAHGGGWGIWLDARSGAPTLVQGQGIPWIAGIGNRLSDPSHISLDVLEPPLRRFIAANRTLLLANDAELVLNAAASGKLTDQVWQVVFDRVVAGVPVLGDRYLFLIGQGNLVLFGASRWSRIDTSAVPSIDEHHALALLYAYMGVDDRARAEVIEGGSLRFVPTASAPPAEEIIGGGYGEARLVWRFAVRVSGEPGTWVAHVNARTGEIRAFYDDDRYARVKGGIDPISDDQRCPEGCEQPGFPMPYADVTIGAAQTTAGGTGLFECTPAGSTATTTLAGPYVRILDACGAVSESVTCDGDLDLSASAGNDCAVPPGSSAGDTHSARTGFYHLNRASEHARRWLPSNTWLAAQLTDYVNLASTCNSFWDGSALNFYRSGAGCNNTGEIPGVILHEWGHGLDENDGGGYDNPSEAYADITAFLATHLSCVGRGYLQSGNCDGYGNACLDCTGIRDHDWDKRADHTPSTPAGFLATHCDSGGGPCGKNEHCESYVGAEAIWDLAARDLPAAGIDSATAWQLVDKLWYESRSGSGGDAYHCSLPGSDGCAATSWFSKLRAIDDEDGNLANGTPHAAAIFEAFNRHGIACGTANDPSNRSRSTCPSLSAPTLVGTAGAGAASLSWTPATNAAGYYVFRSDAGCEAGYTLLATVPAPGTSYTDAGLADGFAESYRVQPHGENAACDGALSNCETVTPEPAGGAISLDATRYTCASLITVTVSDGNIGSDTTTAALLSGTETTPETITLTRVAPAIARYTGTILATSAAPEHDGILSLANGDTITARYLDADDGRGNTNIPRETTALADCVAPVISNVGATEVTGSSALIQWMTNEPSTSVVHYGTSTPPASTTSSTALVTAHSIPLAGLAECSSYLYSVGSTDGAGNAALDDRGGTYYGFTTGRAAVTSYASAGGPIAIPDNDPTGATSAIAVSDDKTVTDVNVTIDITHTYDGDLTLTVITPTETSITLAARRGGSGDNFRNTAFDDEAATPIASGSPPFTGPFVPETPLSVADGIRALGEWRLKAVDGSADDTGTIDGWTLTLSYSPGTCGAHAVYAGEALVSDTCATGGAGNGDGFWDAGEQDQFSVTIRNDGTVPLTGVTATSVPLTPGVTMIRSTASYDDLPSGAAGVSRAPHFTAHLPTSIACGTTLAFQLNIQSAQGSWSGSFGQIVGRQLPTSGTALDESFSSGIPPTWTVVDGGTGGGTTSTWTTSNPGSRSIAAPMAAPTAIIDSDWAGGSATQDEQLITPRLDLSSALSAMLVFDQYFRWYSGGRNEIAGVDVRSSRTGGTWGNVLRQQSASSANPDHRTIDITAQAAGAADAQVRFHYYQGSYEWYWQLDNVAVSYTLPGGCAMNACQPAGVAKPVADGSFGTAMRCTRLDVEGTTITVTWDVTTCSSTDHHIVYGNLASIASYSVGGGVCGLGTSGSYTWSGVPSGNLWFIVVGDDGASTEGSWGTLKGGGSRNGSNASGQCGDAIRDNSGTCP